ncbi:hypothetical protein QFC22_003930 [Naganishia vaughanmartiniae]|uniref:Uncharacterized protein n=1 Tax=Naganishia vaughanmartiniae TaxID=1424756 RepID=A0ACC2X5P9_9TREE|nr:hypothetical protein QFC22_003930 [Naganishia vaughanmartiniae]
MSYHFPSVQFNCHRGRKIVFPSSVFGRPASSGDFALTPSRPSSSSAATPILAPPLPEVHDSCLVMQQMYEADQYVYPTTYPTVFKDLEAKMEPAPLQTSPVLPFPVVDYFAYIAWDIMHGKIDTAFPSALNMAINPPTPPPQAPTLQPEPAFRDYLQRLVTTTAVSQSVVVVALFYLYKARARLQPQLIISDIVDKRYGYSICAASLMLANKFLDDNTYTSRTWATLSGYTLWEINDCERGLLSALDFQLNISLPEYNDWWRFLTMYGPSFTYSFTPSSVVPEMSRPATAEVTAPLMKVPTRRVPRVEVLSRPGSRKRSYPDGGVDSPNKRSMLASQGYERLASDQPLVYHAQPCTVVQQPYAAHFVQDLQPPPSDNPFAFDWSATLQQDCPLGYYKLVASPADPRGDDHYRKAQLVQPPLQQHAPFPRPCVPSMLHHSILPPTYTRPLSAPIQSALHHDNPVTFQHPFEDYLSYYDTGSVYSQQMSNAALPQHEALAKFGAALASGTMSVYPDNTVDLTQLDGYLHAN